MKKKDDRIPCAALLAIKSIVAFEWPCKISKLLGPETFEQYCEVGSFIWLNISQKQKHQNSWQRVNLSLMEMALWCFTLLFATKINQNGLYTMLGRNWNSKVDSMTGLVSVESDLGSDDLERKNYWFFAKHTLKIKKCGFGS